MLHKVTTPLPADINLQGGGKPSAQHTSVLWQWLYFLFILIYILISLSLGMILLILPWLHSWENNYLLFLYPRLRMLVANPFFKGFVLGLGIANILIGIGEVAKMVRDINANDLSR
jgi:hypothetical protein